MTEVKMFIAKSKLSGRFFKWEQYVEGGLGRSEDTLDIDDIKSGDIPDLFTVADTTSQYKRDSFHKHTLEEVEFIEVTISF